MINTSSSCPYSTHKRLDIIVTVQLVTFYAVILCFEGHGGEVGIVELIQSGKMSVFDMQSTYYNGDILKAECMMRIT